MKNNQFSVENIASIVAAVLAQMQGSSVTENVEKTSAKVSHNVREVAEKRGGGSEIEDVVIDMRSKASDRLKLPKRMFFGKQTCTVDGEQFESLTSDQGRSAPQFPSVFGGTENSVITFSHVKGRTWTASVSGGKASSKKAQKPARAEREVPVPAKKTSKASSGKVGSKVSVSSDSKGSIAKQFEEFAEMAIANASHKPKPIENQNIKEKGTIEGLDARLYLVGPSQAGAFRKFWKANNMRLSVAVRKLNRLVFDESMFEDDED